MGKKGNSATQLFDSPFSYISIHVHNYERTFHYIPSLKYQLVLTLGLFLTNELFF